jgi:hypothetical protein
MGSLLRNSTYWNRQTIVQVRGATPAAYVPGINPLPVVEPAYASSYFIKAILHRSVLTIGKYGESLTIGIVSDPSP